MGYTAVQPTKPVSFFATVKNNILSFGCDFIEREKEKYASIADFDDLDDSIRREVEVKQKVVGFLIVTINVVVTCMTKDATASVLLVPVGLMCMFSKKVLVD